MQTMPEQTLKLAKELYRIGYAAMEKRHKDRHPQAVVQKFNWNKTSDNAKDGILAIAGYVLTNFERRKKCRPVAGSSAIVSSEPSLADASGAGRLFQPIS